jgi:hypothetical protein
MTHPSMEAGPLRDAAALSLATELN